MKNNDALELLRRLVSIDSVNPFQTIEVDGEELGIGNETNINLFLEETLQELGFSTKRQIVQEARIVEKNGEARKIPERWNLLAEKGEGERALLLFGHSDTVDVKDGWKTDPFLLSQDHLHGRKIHRGLGANDMKGGLAALVAAVSRVDELPKGWKLKIAILVDEEFWSYGAVQLLKSDFINDVKLALVPEIADALPDPSVQFLGLGRLGRAEFVVDVHGKACHGAFALIDPEAVNAVHESVHLQSVFIRYAQKSASRFEAGKISIENSAYINHHAGGKGVLSVPDFASFIFDRTLIPGEDLLEEQQKLLNLIESAKEQGLLSKRTHVTLSQRPRPTPPCQPYFIEEDSPEVQLLKQAAQKVTSKIHLGIGRSVADENRFVEIGIPTLIVAPNGHGYHTSEEWVDEESLYRVSRILEEAIYSLNFLAPQDSV